MRLSGNLRSAAIRSQQDFVEPAVSADGFENAEVRHDEADFIKIVRIRAQRKLYAVFQTERKKFRIRTVSRMTVDLRRHAVTFQKLNRRKIQILRLRHAAAFRENTIRMRQNLNAGTQESFHFLEKLPLQCGNVVFPEKVMHGTDPNLRKRGVFRQKRGNSFRVYVNLETLGE